VSNEKESPLTPIRQGRRQLRLGVSAADIGILSLIGILGDISGFYAATVAPVIRVLSLASE
jgi:hypothetical protein